MSASANFEHAPDPTMSTSAATLRSYHFPEPVSISSTAVSHPSPPPSRSSPDNSPPDSPSSGSVSSLPSVSSSFFFSSAAASPPHSHSSLPQDHIFAQGFIIPSLTLPTPFRRPTPYGQTLGDLRVLVLGRKGADKSLLPALVLEDNEDIVEVGNWEETEYGHTLKASTDWIERRDAHGLERFEPLRNTEFAEFPMYDSDTDIDELVHNIKSYIQKPFHSVADVLHPKHQASPLLSSLLSSPCSPLYTALVLLLPANKTADNLDRRIIDDLGVYIPVIAIPPLSDHRDQNPDQSLATRQNPILSSFRPRTLAALRAGLFHSPETIALLRGEAADRFMRWRVIECTVADIYSARNGKHSSHVRNYGSEDLEAGSSKWEETMEERRSPSSTWDKAKWELEWMPTFSVDVAKRMRQGTVTQAHPRFRKPIPVVSDLAPNETCADDDSEPDVEMQAQIATSPLTPRVPATHHSPSDEKTFNYNPDTQPFSETGPSPVLGKAIAYDPLHFPSLLLFSMSLLGPLKERFDGSLSFIWDALGEAQVRVALIGGFVVGIGVGLAIR
ncbi:hypothetical protein AX17_001648 [Amanita inopinata Kibby_2008]|nr:hypothetical protein AX17_001648 [Amanita inopinata Kibby_2008]